MQPTAKATIAPQFMVLSKLTMSIPVVHIADQSNSGCVIADIRYAIMVSNIWCVRIVVRAEQLNELNKLTSEEVVINNQTKQWQN